LFLVTIAASGDRKTTADGEALWPIRRHEKNLKERNAPILQSYRIALTAWRGTAKKIENSSGCYEEKKAELTQLGPEPDKPLYPILTAPEPTIEGLAKTWVDAPASQGIFSADGGQFLGGYGMMPERKLKTAADLSELWDGRGMRRLRATDGLTIAGSCRLPGEHCGKTALSRDRPER
jgi:hypothetical protein